MKSLCDTASLDRKRFDEDDEYRDDYYAEYTAKIAQAKAGLMLLLQVLDE